MTRVAIMVAALVLGAVTAMAESRDEEIEDLKRSVESMQKLIDEQNNKIDQLQKNEAAAAGPGADVAEASPVKHRPAFNDEQEPAPRPDDVAIDPKLRGFIPVPNTGVLIKFNARARVNFTYDPKNTGDDNRFVTSKIPVTGDPDAGGPAVANINSKGTRLSIDVRAPRRAGNPRFYYENDFFGSGSDEFNFRIRHLYGKVFNLIGGMTFGILEDPDIWPDTIDDKGPNAMIRARIALLRYQYRIDPQWLVAVGVEQPGSSPGGSEVTGVNHAPDAGLHVRWEGGNVGHVQLAGIARDIGARSATFGDHQAFGWGMNLSGVCQVFEDDSILAQATYGHGIESLGNDTVNVNADAAFDEHGNLVTIPYFGGFAGYTHTWTEEWRSTATYGFVNLEPQPSQGPSAYRRTHYASLNLAWDIRKRLSIGVEALYGHKETQSGARGDAVRTQFGFMYSIF